MTTALPKNTGLFLSLDGNLGSPVTGLYEVNGLPARKFKKELIRVGRFTHPANGLEFEVNSDTLDGWVKTFAEMTADGEPVTLAASHANTSGEGRGFVRDLFREEDSLYGIVECIGEDALSAAARTNVSIYAESVFKSGSGKAYPWAIQHVAFTNRPVVPGLKPFEALAASADKHNKTTIILALDTGTETMPEEIAVSDPTVTDVNPKDAVRKSFKAIAMKLWDDETLDIAAFIGKVKELRKKQTDILTKLGDDDPTNDPKPEDVPADAEVAPSIVASNDVVVDPVMVGLLADNRRSKLALAVQAGEITPAASKELETMFVGEGNTAITLSLSHKTPDMFDATLKAVKAQGPALKIGEQSPGQTLALSNVANAPVENLLVANAEKRAKAAKK